MPRLLRQVRMFWAAMRRPTACGAVDMATADVAGCGRTLVLVPHADEETIGCGGLLAWHGRAGLPVHVVVAMPYRDDAHGDDLFRHHLGDCK